MEGQQKVWTKESAVEHLKKCREKQNAEDEKHIQFRDENGNIKISFDTSLREKFDQEREDKLNELDSISFETLLKHFMSKKDYNKVTQLRNLSKLQPSQDPDFEQEKVIICSFPRCGNTLTRAYVQKITGIIVGSQSQLSHVQSRDLFLGGMWGEGLRDDRVWCYKTHYPNTTFDGVPKEIHKAIIITRNPIDAIVSNFQLNVTKSHEKAIHPIEFDLHRKAWQMYLQQELTVWYDFYKFWLETKIPIVIIRFEDILNDPYATFSEVMKLLLSTRSIEGRAIQKYLELVAKEQAPQVYSMKSEKKLKCEHKDKYLKEDLEFMYENAHEVLERFGYEYLFTGQPEAENPLEFINQFNQEKLELAIKLEKEGNTMTMKINLDEECIRLANENRPMRQTQNFGRPLGKIIEPIDKSKLKEILAKQKEDAGRKD